MLASKNYVEVVKAIRTKFAGERPLYGYVDFDTVECDDYIPAKLGVIHMHVSLSDDRIDFTVEFKDGSQFGHSILTKEEKKND